MDAVNVCALLLTALTLPRKYWRTCLAAVEGMVEQFTLQLQLGHSELSQLRKSNLNVCCGGLLVFLFLFFFFGWLVFNHGNNILKTLMCSVVAFITDPN